MSDEEEITHRGEVTRDGKCMLLLPVQELLDIASVGLNDFLTAHKEYEVTHIEVIGESGRIFFDKIDKSGRIPPGTVVETGPDFKV